MLCYVTLFLNHNHKYLSSPSVNADVLLTVQWLLAVTPFVGVSFWQCADLLFALTTSYAHVSII